MGHFVFMFYLPPQTDMKIPTCEKLVVCLLNELHTPLALHDALLRARIAAYVQDDAMRL